MVLGIHLPITSVQIAELQERLQVSTSLDLHLTLLLMPIPEIAKIEVEAQLPGILEKLTLPDTIKSAPEVVQDRGNLLLKFSEPRITDMHRQLLDALNPLRGNYIRSKDIERMKDDDYFNEKEWKMVEKYGFAYSGDLYQPHVSLGIAENLIEVVGIERMLPVKIQVPGIEAMIHHQDVVRSEIYWRCKLD